MPLAPLPTRLAPVLALLLPLAPLLLHLLMLPPRCDALVDFSIATSMRRWMGARETACAVIHSGSLSPPALRCG